MLSKNKQVLKRKQQIVSRNMSSSGNRTKNKIIQYIVKRIVIIYCIFKRMLSIHYTLKGRWIIFCSVKKTLIRHCIIKKAGKTPTEAKGTKGNYSTRWELPFSSSYYQVLIVFPVIDTVADN